MLDWLSFREPVNAWTHGVWLFFAIPATVYLWRITHGQPAKRLSLLVYGLSLSFCFLASSLYHAVWPEHQVQFCATLDYVGIYLLIAGTATPVAVIVFRGVWQWGMLLAAWGLAGAGVALRLLYADMPDALSTALYLGMSWAMILCFFELARILTLQAIVPAFIGGMFYSVGAVFNLAHWPALWPGVFQAHELFHVFVMAGSLAHYRFLVKYVLPYDVQTAAELIPVSNGLLSQ
jgi:hemolysin III